MLLPGTAAHRTTKQGGEWEMTIEIMEVEEITATRIHLDPEAGGA
ncbi:hypothetical protein [Cellulomonas biazotea]|nr:hypothetical protein [Cellulomonas biazotea]